MEGVAGNGREQKKGKSRGKERKGKGTRGEDGREDGREGREQKGVWLMVGEGGERRWSCG